MRRLPGSDRLPGGLGVLPGVIMAFGGVKMAFALVSALALTYLLAVTLFLMPWIGAALVFWVLGGPIFAFVAGRRGVRVDAVSQPALAALVAEVVRYGRGRPPRRIWLSGEPTVRAATYGGRPELHIGLPLLTCLDEPQLRALVGHELSILDRPYPWLVTRLLARWAGAIDQLDDEETNGRRRRERLVARLAPFAADVHGLADAAAASAGGGVEVGARAFALVEMATLEHSVYLAEVELASPPRRPVAHLISDLDTGWRRVMARGVEPGWLDEDRDRLARHHAGLAAGARWLEPASVRLSVVPRPVAVSTLTRRQERRLAREVLTARTNEWIRWHMFADAPRRWWAERAAREVIRLRQDIRLVVQGSPPANDLELAHVLLNHDVADELARFPSRRYEYHARARRTGLARSAPPILAGLVEHALFARGWRLEHPAVRGVLVGPTCQRVDIRELVTFGEDGTADLSGLRPYLDTTAAVAGIE